MALLLVSFLAGVLTVLAPCVLPLLPIIIGGAAQHKRNPYVITASLAVSIVVFTLLLKFSTIFIMVPATVWSAISGVIIIVFGIVSLFPNLWTRFSTTLRLQQSSDRLLESAAQKPGLGGDILLGLSFGPVFSSCSPTYFVILATVLPQTFALGVVYLAVYALGLSIVLLLISLLGQRFVSKIRWAANPSGWFKKSLGILFILVGIFILTGADKKLQTYLLEKGYFDITNIEYKLLQEEAPESEDVEGSIMNYPRYQEIRSPSGFVNTEPIILADLVGQKIILLDFMTYSCINCIRTFPYLNAWYEEYADDGLEIIGIHTPEFAFEKDIDNVTAAMAKYGIEFPVVLDNDYATWNAYGNRYWPRKYLIDYQGQIVYDHIGEGEYEETEAKIRELLGLEPISPETTEATPRADRSPETYFGANRNDFLLNGQAGVVGIQELQEPESYPMDKLILSGTWNIEPESASASDLPASVHYKYIGTDVFLVASSETLGSIQILRDGLPLPRNLWGSDVRADGLEAAVDIQADQLYWLIGGDDGQVHELELQVLSPEIKFYTFTFGS